MACVVKPKLQSEYPKWCVTIDMLPGHLWTKSYPFCTSVAFSNIARIFSGWNCLLFHFPHDMEIKTIVFRSIFSLIFHFFVDKLSSVFVQFRGCIFATSHLGVLRNHLRQGIFSLWFVYRSNLHASFYHNSTPRWLTYSLLRRDFPLSLYYNFIHSHE